MIKLYIRYDAQLHRHYRNCLKDLRDLQAERALAPDPKPEPPNEPKLTPEEARALAEKAKIRRLMEINLGLKPVENPR